MLEERTSNDAYQIQAVGHIERYRRLIEALASRLEMAPHWQPSYALKAQCNEAIRLLNELAKRSEGKLAVALIGPSGAGKSTILNALARQDGLSTVGNARPTTREVVVYCKNADDAQPLIEKLGGERVSIVSSPAAAELDQVILVDTPDTDSQMCPEHRVIIERVVGNIDVLLCVFNSENPKRADNIDFLAPIVDKFPKEFLFAILSHCDRRPENELREVVLPDFRRHVEEAWRQKPKQVFCVSGRRNLTSPHWDANATPLHEFDEFDQLCELVFGSINHGSVVVDARIKRAERIWGVVAREAAERTSKCLNTIEVASGQIRDLNSQALQAAARTLDTFQSQATLGVQLLLYRQLAQRWWGPVGVLIALWGRMLLFGTGILNLLRFGNPFAQLRGIILSAIRYWRSDQAMGRVTESQWVRRAMQEYRMVVAREWTDIGKPLVQVGFDTGVLDPSSSIALGKNVGSDLSLRWEDAIHAEIDATSRKLSGALFQVLLNVPVIALIIVVSYQCVTSFWKGEYLSSDYFRHALVTIGLVWAMFFTVLQVVAIAMGGDRLLQRATARLFRELGSGQQRSYSIPLLTEINSVKQIGEFISAASASAG